MSKTEALHLIPVTEFSRSTRSSWAMPLRLDCRARTGEGDRACRLLRTLIGSRPFPNLWDALRDLTVSRPDLRLAWKGAEGCRYNVYRSVDGAPGYEALATRLTAGEFRDSGLDFAACGIVTYKVTACRPDGGGESDVPTVTLNHATTLDIERYRHRVRQQNQEG